MWTLRTVHRYPMLTNKIFEVFLCRDLGPDTTPAAVLHTDYTVGCDETAVLPWGVGTCHY